MITKTTTTSYVPGSLSDPSFAAISDSTARSSMLRYARGYAEDIISPDRTKGGIHRFDPDEWLIERVRSIARLLGYHTAEGATALSLVNLRVEYSQRLNQWVTVAA